MSNQQGQTGNMNMSVILGGVTGDSSIQSELPISSHLHVFCQTKQACWMGSSPKAANQLPYSTCKPFIKLLLIITASKALGFFTFRRYYFHCSSEIVFCFMLFICSGIGPLVIILVFSSLFLFLTFFLPVFPTCLLYPSLLLLESMQSSHGCPECKVELAHFQCHAVLWCLKFICTHLKIYIHL